MSRLLNKDLEKAALKCFEAHSWISFEFESKDLGAKKAGRSAWALTSLMPASGSFVFNWLLPPVDDSKC